MASEESIGVHNLAEEIEVRMDTVLGSSLIRGTLLSAPKWHGEAALSKVQLWIRDKHFVLYGLMGDNMCSRTSGGVDRLQG